MRVPRVRLEDEAAICELPGRVALSSPEGRATPSSVANATGAARSRSTGDENLNPPGNESVESKPIRCRNSFPAGSRADSLPLHRVAATSRHPSLQPPSAFSEQQLCARGPLR